MLLNHIPKRFRQLQVRSATGQVAFGQHVVDQSLRLRALQIHGVIFERIPGVADRRTESFRVLRKALGYTLSVVVCTIPKEGFEFVEQSIASQEPDVLWIVKQNLKKNRLVANYPREGEAIQQLLSKLT
jgi:hypothetical protein